MTRDLIAVRCERGASIAQPARLSRGDRRSHSIARRALVRPRLRRRDSRRRDPAARADRQSRADARGDARHRTVPASPSTSRRSGAEAGSIRSSSTSSAVGATTCLVALPSRADARSSCVAAEPADQIRFMDDDGLDDIALAFADIIDAKSPYTYRHSSRVAEYARTSGEPPRVRCRRAAADLPRRTAARHRQARRLEYGSSTRTER